MAFVFLYDTCFIVVILDGVWSMKCMRLWSYISDHLPVFFDDVRILLSDDKI